ncbi:MAG TPA: DUF427 domain-containing protein [Acidimicrobiales bacterium]|nr:DUF427 domain-containing protein [Acidimicrobiales bacterium]
MPDLATWKVEMPPWRVEPSPRWIRVRAGETTVADSRRAQLLVWFGPGMLPTYCLPADDVHTDFFVPASQPAGPPFLVDHDVRVGDLVVPGGARLFRDPPPPIDGLGGYWTFTWDQGMTWVEEALEIHVHARDPSKRVDAVPSERHVQVELDGRVVADSRRPVAVFETDLPTRWYLPMDDVDQDVLVPSATETACPYKGTARYWSVRVGDRAHPDLAWSYPDPVVECPRIKGLLAFFNEKVDLIVDGVRQERPRSPWSD